MFKASEFEFFELLIFELENNWLLLLFLEYWFWFIPILLLDIPRGARPPNGGAAPPSWFFKLAKYLFNFLSMTTLIYCFNKNLTINNFSLGSEYAFNNSPNLESNSLNCCLNLWHIP